MTEIDVRVTRRAWLNRFVTGQSRFALTLYFSGGEVSVSGHEVDRLWEAAQTATRLFTGRTLPGDCPFDTRGRLRPGPATREDNPDEP